MKLKIIVILLILYGVISQESLFAQNNDRWFPPPFPELSRELLFLDPLVFYNIDSNNARLDLYIEIPVPAIIFKRNSTMDIFESSLEMSITIEDSEDLNSFSKVYNEHTSFTDEEMKSEAKGSLYFLKVFYEKPGNYKLNLKIKDFNSNREYIKQDSISIRYKSNIFFSDIMILSDYKIDSEGKKEITPLVNKNVFNFPEFYIFFEIYSNSDTTINKEYTYRIKDDKDKIISESSFYYNLSAGVNKEFEKIFFYNSQYGIFKIEIIDKSTQEIVVTKRFVNFPHILKQGRMPENIHKPRN
jgi:hypothetical protein